MKVLIILIGLTFFSCNPEQPKSNSIQNESEQSLKPDYKIALKFINDYVTFCNDLSSNLSTNQWLKNQPLVTTKFQNELEKIIIEAKTNDPELGLGFDPILDAQDYPDKFELSKTDDKYLIVKGIDWPNFQLTLKLDLIDGNWLVDGSGIINIPSNKRIER